jgi:ectoine hydroxylase-related dioxygenase (phytanoyl-CoA dioxygenase family)
MLGREITQREIDTFHTDGIVCLRGLFDTDWVEKMRDAAERSMDRPTDMAIEMAETQGKAGRFYFDTFVWRHNPICRDFVFNSPAAEIASQVMGSRKINVFFDQWLIKERGTDVPTPWHHDLPYWPVDGDQVSTIWLALDEVDLASGAVEYIKGSHRWGKRFLPETFSGTVAFTEDLPKIPDIEAERDRHDIVHFDLVPGDCTVHHGLLVHAAPGNREATRRRRAYVTRWAGDDAVFHPREGIQHMPPLPDIAPGGALDSDLWPVIWRDGNRAGTDG